MKKRLSLILATVLILSLVACGSDNGSNETPGNSVNATLPETSNSTVEPEEETQYYQLGDTVSTDIIEFTLDEASMTIALSSVYDENFFTAKEYDAQNDADNPYVAPKGHTYAAFTYTVTNLDRASVKFHNGSFASVEYADEIYSELEEGAYFLYQDAEYLDSNGKLQKDEANTWHSYPSENLLLSVGETETRRAYVDMTVDVEDMSSDFKLIVEIPTSDGTKSSFTYLITEAGN